MDNFEYTMWFNKIQAVTTVAGLESILRELRNKFYKISTIYDTTKKLEVDIETLKKVYKLYTFTLSLFKNKSSRKLPDFISTFKADIEKLLTYKLFVMETDTITYEQFIDLFQYSINDTIICHGNYGIVLKTIAEIVKDKENPYTFNYNYKSNIVTKVRAIANILESKPNGYGYCELKDNSVLHSIYLVELFKQSLPSTAIYTILEKELELLYGTLKQSSTDHIKQNYSDILLQKQMLETVLQKIK